MASRRAYTYAKVYSFGTNGSAALAGTSIAERRAPEPSPRRTHAPARAPVSGPGIRLPVWVVLVALTCTVFTLSFFLLGVRAQETFAAKKVNMLRAELTGTEELISALEVKIAEANDPQRIHSIAVNRLRMRQPEEEQVQVVPRPYVHEQINFRLEAVQEKPGLIGALLSLVGL